MVDKILNKKKKKKDFCLCKTFWRNLPAVIFDSLTMESSNSFDSAVGDIKILEVNQEGKYVRLVNDGKQVNYYSEWT